MTCLFWQSGESHNAQSSPFRLLTVWDWSVQFEPKAQALLNNPLYAEKPKPDKSQRKTTRFKVSCLVSFILKLYKHVFEFFVQLHLYLGQMYGKPGAKTNAVIGKIKNACIGILWILRPVPCRSQKQFC